MDVVDAAIREPGSRTVPAYVKRVRRLAAIYAGLFLFAAIGLLLLLWRSRLLVTLTQRSNVETLTLGFFFVFFLYVAALCSSAVPGTLRLCWYGLARHWQGEDEVERRKHRALGAPKDKQPLVVAVNRTVEREDRPGEPFDLQVADGIGAMGVITIDGARVTLLPARRQGSNNLLAFLVHQIQEVVGERDGATDLQVVEWKSLDDEQAEEFLSLATFARNLEKKLGVERLWPTVRLTRADAAELERRLSDICPALRSEAFLPHWEYKGEHKFPIIPEPLGIISLTRSERRVDPEASMLSAFIVVALAVVLLSYLIARPPWVPG